MTDIEKLRLDKWLWAARFFKTRSLAKQAIENGKVRVDGQRTKPSREISVGAVINLRQGWDEKTVIAALLSAQRRGAPEAAKMYQETRESQEKRTLMIEQRKSLSSTRIETDGRPSKKQRRQIHRFINKNNE